ncbi:MAG: HAD hydrolase-like protein [Oscillospiraceae bacterium]|nr:HAD hydrolase-like protein [Oscillospiraceae bacterium]
MKYNIILFDLDGTLTDPKVGITTCCQYGLRAVGVDVPDLKELEQFIGPPLLPAFQEVYGLDEEQALKAIDKFRERFQSVGLYENELLPGVPQMLRTLKEHGKILATASSKPEVFVKQILQHFDIDSWFDEIVGSTMDEKHAGKAEVIGEALRRLGCADADRDSILMVGDRMHDVEGAAALNIRTVGVTFGYGSRSELEQAGAWRIADTMEELTDILLG